MNAQKPPENILGLYRVRGRLSGSDRTSNIIRRCKLKMQNPLVQKLRISKWRQQSIRLSTEAPKNEALCD